MKRRQYDINGVKHWLMANTEQEIADKYASLKLSTQNEKTSSRNKRNFRSFAKDNWKYVIQNVSPGTAKDYEGYMKNHILPYFGDMGVDKIDWRCVQEFYDKHQDYSYSSIHKWRIVLSTILQIAIEDGLISTNPTKHKRLSHSKIHKKRPVPTEEEYRLFLKEINKLSKPHERLYMALVSQTGMRRGEILALKWEDISFDENQINVVSAINIDNTSEKSWGVLKEPKTKSGIRKIPLTESLKTLLLEEKHHYEFVVTDLEKGRPLHVESWFNTMWKSIKKQMDLGNYTSHSFRHAMCTFLLSNGTDIKTTQQILGHSQPSTTLNIYSHAMPSKIMEAGKLFSEKMMA
jgi:integrase